MNEIKVGSLCVYIGSHPCIGCKVYEVEQIEGNIVTSIQKETGERLVCPASDLSVVGQING